MKKLPKHRYILADWKATDDLLIQLQKALRAFNVHLQVHFQGDDNFHVTVSESKLTKAQFRAVYEAAFGFPEGEQQ